MIPVRLTLRNFMCYRENVPPLSFNGIHTACICGDNGNGKSAIIDAITWALWGKARAKSDLDLIAQGQNEMAVEFDFAVGEQIYRIIRKYAKPKTRTGSGHPVLEFQAAVKDGFRPVTGNTISQTQQKIIDTLHMDYDTFVNSAFLKQGHADEFTNQPPAKRKEVLAAILGLTQYDELEARARESMNIWEDNVKSLRSVLEGIVGDLALKPLCEAELVQAQGELERIDKLVGEQEIRVAELRKRCESLENKKNQLAQLEKHIAETNKARENWTVRVNQHQAKIKEYEALLVQRSGIEEGYRRYTEIKKLNDELNQKLSLLVRLNERKNRIELTIEKAKNELLREHALTQQKINELNIKKEKLPQLRADQQRVEEQHKRLTEMENAIESRRQAAQQLRETITKLEANVSLLQSQIKEIDEKLALLNTGSEAKCPLCEQALGPAEYQRIETGYITDKKNKQDRLTADRQAAADHRLELNRLDKDINQRESELKKERTSVLGKMSVLQKSTGEAMEAIANLDIEKSNLADIEQRLAKHEFAVSEQQALSALENEIAGLNYNNVQHEQTRRQLSDLAKYEEPKRKLDDAEKSVGSERDSLSQAEKAVAELAANQQTDLQQKEILAAELTVLPRLIIEFNNNRTEYQKLTEAQKQARETLGRAKEKLQHCMELEVKKVEKEKQLAISEYQAKIYQELAQAFGKKGIQALLIEMAIPEIEIEADRLLSRMTENRMHVKMETQRETKKGDVTETLDINVSDELGTRNYEMFSGGEAFRINFAIRIALSRILARRAGAPLPTLIIDEGFGTQDNTGIEKLKEAIISVQDDFEKILVITHIDELKDAFPTRIDVNKTAEGSTITLN